MPKVLIIGPDYFNFLPAVEKAFTRLGWEASVAAYDNPIHPYTVWMKWRYKLSRHRDRLQARSRAAFDVEVRARFTSCRPDLVFILNGDILENAALDHFRDAGAKVALWLFDNRERLPRCREQASHVDRLFCFEQEDVDWFRAQGVKSVFLPQACDPDVYKPLGLPPEIDILFVGNLWNSEKRKRTMLSVIRAFPERKIVVYGLYHPWYKGLGKWLRRPYKRIFKNCNVSPERVNELYNSSRVVLNIHQELQKSGANPRVFEICGSGAYQVCDANAYVRSLFEPGSVGFYSTEAELTECLREALSGDKGAQAAAAHQTVYARHTFVNRIRTVLENMEEA